MTAVVGDPNSIFTDLYPQLVRLAATIVGPDSAADVVSQVYLNLGSRTSSDVQHGRAYLFRAVANESISVQRSVRRRWARNARYLGLNPSVDSDVVSNRDLDVERALGRLSPQQRAVIHLTYWEDLTPTAIAATLEVSEGSVRKQLARARRRLRKELGYADHR